MHRSFLVGDAATAEETGAFVLEHLAVSIRRVMQFRQLHGDARFIDVPHSHFTADPFGTLDCIYRKLDAQLAPDARSKLESWLERNRKGAHGEHTYTAEEFGLEAGAIRVMFQEYIDKFAL